MKPDSGDRKPESGTAAQRRLDNIGARSHLDAAIWFIRLANRLWPFVHCAGLVETLEQLQGMIGRELEPNKLTAESEEDAEKGCDELFKLAPDMDGLQKVLTWISLYVTNVNSLPSARGEMVEVCAADGDNAVVITRTGKDMPTAFFKCVAEAMKQIPDPASASSAPSAVQKDFSTAEEPVRPTAGTPR